MDSLSGDAAGNLPSISAFSRWPGSVNIFEAVESTAESKVNRVIEVETTNKDKGHTLHVLFKGNLYIHDIREVKDILKQEISDALQENSFESESRNCLPRNINKEVIPTLTSLATHLFGSSRGPGNMSASNQPSQCPKPGQSAQAPSSIQAAQTSGAIETTHTSSQIDSAQSLGTKLLIQAAVPSKPDQSTPSGKSNQHIGLNSTRIYPVLPVEASDSTQRRTPDPLGGPVRGFFTPEKFGPLPALVEQDNRPHVDFSVGLRRHDLPPREEINWFSRELPTIDRSDYLRFYATQMFSDEFLKKFLKVDSKAYGEVDPYLCPDTKMPMYPRTVWLLEVSKQLHLPHTIGAHGLMIQKEVPVPTTKTVPLFIGEKGFVTCWWYAGEFQVDDGELFAPITKKHRKSMQGWAERFAEWSVEKEKDGSEWNHITKAQWKNAMYDRMLSKVRDPSPCDST